MEDKKELIEELKHEQEEKKKRIKVILGSLIVLCLIGAVYTYSGNIDINLKNNNIDYSQEVVIDDEINPYRVRINSSETIKFQNNRDTAVTLRFETNELKEHITIASSNSRYLDLSDYRGLPKRNYYTVNGENTGEIVIQ